MQRFLISLYTCMAALRVQLIRRLRAMPQTDACISRALNWSVLFAVLNVSLVGTQKRMKDGCSSLASIGQTILVHRHATNIRLDPAADLPLDCQLCGLRVAKSQIRRAPPLSCQLPQPHALQKLPGNSMSKRQPWFLHLLSVSSFLAPLRVSVHACFYRFAYPFHFWHLVVQYYLGTSAILGKVTISSYNSFRFCMINILVIVFFLRGSPRTKNNA